MAATAQQQPGTQPAQVSPPQHLDGGLVTSRDASDPRDPGALTLADDAEYLPDDPAPWKINGRTAFNSTPEAAPIVGIRFLAFDNDSESPDQIVALVGTKYRIAPAGATGIFSDLATGLLGTATSFDSVQQANQHFLLNGVDRNRYLDRFGNLGLHGMLAAIFTPQVDIAAGAGAGFTFASGNTMLYWIEERVKDAHGTIVRRQPCDMGQVFTVVSTGAVIKPRIYRTDIRNSDATHYGVYASAPNGLFPTGAEVGEANINDPYFDDLRTGTITGLPPGTTYPSFSATIQGVTTAVARYGVAPIATTGDVFQASLCLNDVKKPRRVWCSYYREPQAFPALFFFDFDTKEHDVVVAIRSLGAKMAVLLQDSAWVITGLPDPTATNFIPEDFMDVIADAYGCVSACAVAEFTMPATQFPRPSRMLAYVSPYGIVGTDTQMWNLLSADLNWNAAVDVSQLSSARLINNVAKSRLELYAAPPGGGTRVAYFFSYHPAHIKSGGRLKVTGPIHRDATDACLVRINGALVPFTAATDMRVYQNDSGTSEPSYPGGIAFNLRSHLVYPAGVGNEAIIRRVLIRHSAGVSGQQATVRIRQFDENRNPNTPSTAILKLDREEASTGFQAATGEAFDIAIENSDALGPFRVPYFVLDLESAGAAQST